MKQKHSDKGSYFGQLSYKCVTELSSALLTTPHSRRTNREDNITSGNNADDLNTLHVCLN